MRTRSIVVWMIIALAAVATLAAWDASRESARALDDFTREQITTARALAATMESNASFRSASSIEEPHVLIVLFFPRGSDAPIGTDGHRVDAPFLLDAVSANEASLRLTREQAGSLDLSHRMAMAGFASVASGSAKDGVVIVVASAERVRDHDRRALWRLLLSVSLAAALVLTFGGLAVRKQGRELVLKHALEIANIQEERDRKLAVADKIATMGALATGIAHEVSTPLGVIVGRAEQLQSKVTDEKDKKAIAAILEQSDRISRIVRGLLGLARGDSPSFENVSAASIATQARELVMHRFEKAQVGLAMTMAEDLPSVKCEPRLLEQALVNLLLNACDACNVGGHVALRVSCHESRVQFVVEDDGEGITPEAAARATEAFFTTKAAGAGTGLGLAIANEIVKHHGGTISIAARVDETKRGTRASIDVLGADPRLPDREPDA
ncbi:MAG: HAMP domain-containing sensor histidine kinase [Polyangiaceae bacterium]